MTVKNQYAQRYTVDGNCLYETPPGKNGTVKRKLCNLVPEIVEEITVDDGAATATYIKLRGVHESGRTLPEIEIPAAELASFNWMAERWGIRNCRESKKRLRNCGRKSQKTKKQSMNYCS